MATNEKSKDKKLRYRILAMDGGGIYASYSALLLKNICEQNNNFLNGHCVNLFAGTSSGAVNSLLLAKHENPRKAIMDNELVNFWTDAQVNSNSNPWNLMTSQMGISPYFGTQDFRSILQQYFGNITLGELKHAVLITTFDWAGDPNAKDRYWKPKFFDNFSKTDSDWDVQVADVACSAASPMSLRSIWQGKQDGAWFAPDPTMCAITQVLQELFRSENIESEEWAPTRLAKLFMDAIFENEKGEVIDTYSVMDHMSLLSVGVGSKYPFLPVETAEWGTTQWSMGMWNPAINELVQPLTRIALEAPSENVNFQARQLLNQKVLKKTKNGIERKVDYPGYFRLAPQVLKESIMEVTYLLRNNPIYTQYIMDKIKQAAQNPESRKHVEMAMEWLKEERWFVDRTWIDSDLVDN